MTNHQKWSLRHHSTERKRISSLCSWEFKPTNSTLAKGRGPPHTWPTFWAWCSFPNSCFRSQEHLHTSRANQGYQGRLAREKRGVFSSHIIVLWDTWRTECWWWWCGCQGREISAWFQNRCVEIWFADFIMRILVLWAFCYEQENTFTGRLWVMRSSSSLRLVMFAEPTTRDSLERPWSHTKSQIDVGSKLELTCSVTGVVTTLSVWITTPPFRGWSSWGHTVSNSDPEIKGPIR